MSWQDFARIFKINQIERGVLIPVDKFIQKGWISWVWACFLIRFKNKPITRKTIYELTGNPPRTQLEHERNTWVTHVENYADYGSIQDNPLLAIDLYGTPCYYSKSGRIRRRLGNSYHPNSIRLANKGRLKQVNKTLKNNEVSSYKPVYHLYCTSHEELRNIIRKNRKHADVNNRPDFIYQLIVDLPKGSIWEAVPC